MLLTFESVDEIPWCDHSNVTSSAVLSHGTIVVSRAHIDPMEVSDWSRPDGL